MSNWRNPQTQTWRNPLTKKENEALAKAWKERNDTRAMNEELVSLSVLEDTLEAVSRQDEEIVRLRNIIVSLGGEPS